jgi:hypothetical protein
MRLLSTVILAASLAVFAARAADDKKPKADPDKIGDRGVGKCVNDKAMSRWSMFSESAAPSLFSTVECDTHPISPFRRTPAAFRRARKSQDRLRQPFEG